LDPVLIAMHALSIVSYLGGGAALLWACYVAWADHARWVARLWTTTLAVSGLVLLWTATVCHLMAFRTSY